MFQPYLINIPLRAWGMILFLLILSTSKCIHSWANYSGKGSRRLAPTSSQENECNQHGNSHTESGTSRKRPGHAENSPCRGYAETNVYYEEILNDLAVASDKGLNLLTLDGAVESSHLEDDALSDMYAVAFDPAMQRIFYNLNEEEGESMKNLSIYVYSLSHNSSFPVVDDLNHKAEGLAFDTAKEVLYWTDGNGHSIRKRSMKTEESDPQTEVLLHLPNQVPQGIAVSHCHRALFWTNCNHTSASVNRAELDGSKHVQIVTLDVYLPLGITVDEAYGKVYWTDDRQGIFYRIERCSVDGSQRELVIQSTKQQPLGLTLSGNALIWSDTIGQKIYGLSTDMTFPNHTEGKLEPHLLYSYQGYKPAGVTANRNISVSCVPLKILRTFEPEEIEETVGGDEMTDFCLNSGEMVGNTCRCKKGYSGRRCEIPACYNRCLHGGNCYVDRHGYPDCRCQPGYEGRRCERDVCDEYCLSGGRCYVEAGQPACKCSEGSSGQRCEVTSRLALPPSNNDVPIIASLGAFGGALLVVVMVLAWRVIVLRRRPRVKKRYIVNKGRRGQTPMTSRPPAVEQCEITIENCCNMNICETPCFEPNLRTAKSSSSGKKTEDRRNLLKNMEDQSVSD